MVTTAALDRLSTGLAGVIDDVVAASGADRRGPIVVESEPEPFTSSACAEVVRVEVGGVTVARLFCKSAPTEDTSTTDDVRFRWGLGYEAAVYGDVLRPAGIHVPAFRGRWLDPGSRREYLAIDYVDRAVRVAKSADRDAMELAASWLGRFHATLPVGVLTADQRALLHAHDRAYFEAWLGRSQPFLSAAGARHPGLGALSRDPGRVVDLLVAEPRTVVHGDFSPNNVLVTEDRDVLPVDWESAALGAGVVDLASFLERWSPDVAARCVAAYAAEQRGGWSAELLASRLAAARIYHLLRVPGLSAADLGTVKGQRRADRLADALGSL